jgi:lipid-A-disaccharide synthase
MPRRIFITVAEASGDQHAAHLIRELRALEPDIIIEGFGGTEMAAAGAIIHHDTVRKAAMGWKALLRAMEVRRLLKFAEKHFQKHRPDLHICIDSWAMNWHFAKLAHKQKIPVLYYIAPQVWASRPKRVIRLKKYVDHVACILPFEDKFFKDHGMAATFVGHPLFDALRPEDKDIDLRRFPNRPPIIGLLPGSRSSVAKENFPNLLDVAGRIKKAFPDATFVVPTVAATHHVVGSLVARFEHVNGASSQKPAAPPDPAEVKTVGSFTYGMRHFNELVSQCDLCITVCGTATLHVAGHGVPLIVVYRLNPIIWHLVARWVINTRTYSLVNLLNDSREDIVPEFVPWYGSNVPVAEKALEYLHDPKLLLEQRHRLSQLIRGLNKPGASRNVANLAIELMSRGAPPVPPELARQRV